MAGRRGRGARATSGRSRSASTRTASCGSAARSGPGSRARSARTCWRGWRRSRPTIRRSIRRRPKDYRGRWGGDLANITWIRPELVIRAELGGWSRDGIVRQAAFKGIEPDRDPTAVVRETAVATTTAVRAAEADVPEPALTTNRTNSYDEIVATGGSEVTAPVPDTWRVTDDELKALDALGKEGLWRVGADELKLTNLDKPLFEPREPDGGGPITKRELIRYFARIAPTMLLHVAGPAAQPAALPERRRLARLLAEGHPRDRAEVADPLARDRRRRPHRPRRQRPSPRRSSGRAGLARQPGELRDPRLDRPPPEPLATRLRVHRHRPRGEDDLGRDPRPGAALPDRARPPRRPRLSQDDRQARHPGLDPDRAEVRLRRDERVGRAGQSRGRLDRPGPRLLGVGEGGPQGQGPARLHPEREHQDAGRAVFRAAGRRRARVRADRLGRARRPGPAARPLDDPDHRRPRGGSRRPVRRGPDRPPGTPAGLRRNGYRRGPRHGRMRTCLTT